MTDTLARSGIHVELKIAPDLPAGSADPAQLQEVIQEVLDNAQQAMAAQDADRRVDVSLAVAPVAGLRSPITASAWTRSCWSTRRTRSSPPARPAAAEGSAWPAPGD
jgi:signal transduction histidine kinase